jgi:Asp-tRNA(Asn)/Glu-tRNA(Gln) amidotransferase A subunit family amidase
MSSDIIYFDANKLAELIRTREVSPVEIVQAHLDRIGAANPKLNAIVTVADGALEAAKAAEEAVVAGEELGPLHGVPFTVTAGRSEDELYKMAKTMLSLPDTSMKDYIDAEQAAERLRDGYADYFSRYDALITHVLPIPAHKHGVEEFTIDGQTVDATYLQGATVPLNVTGLPGVAMRFGTSKEGLPINVQIVGKWQAESTILHVASLLEGVSPVRDLHPDLSSMGVRP